MRRARKGFAVAGALLLLAVLAALGLSLGRVFSSSQEDFAREAMGARAMQAAKAGAGLARYQSERLGVCESSRVVFKGLEEYPATLVCAARAAREDGAQRRTHVWSVVACNAARCPAPEPSDGYVQRELRVVVHLAP